MNSHGLTVDEINARLARAPYNVWLGVRAVSAADGHAGLLLPWRAEFAGAPGMIHGGVLAALVDLGCYAALLTRHRSVGPTVDLRIDFHGNVGGAELRLDCVTIKSGRRLATADTRILGPDGDLLASGRCVYMVNRERIGDGPGGD